MPEFSQLQTLILVARLGSLAAAARELNISSAAVSKQLTRLEKELGVQLLNRSTRKVELTEIGTKYCEQCRRILEEAEAASDLISNVKALPHGVLKVFSGRHFASSFIVPRIGEFLTKYPGIQLNLELGERMPDLNLEAIDVLIGMSISATGEVIQKRIATTRYVYCASPDYLKKFGEPVKPKDFYKHRYITHSMRQPDDELIFSNTESIKLDPYIRVNDTETMLRLAKDNMGIVKLHYYVVKESLQQGLLVEVLADYTKAQIPLYVAFPQRKFIPSKIRHFIDFYSRLN